MYAQPGLDLVPPVSASPIIGVTGEHHHTQFVLLFFKLCLGSKIYGRKYTFLHFCVG
jgi:hypothetical protein